MFTVQAKHIVHPQLIATVALATGLLTSCNVVRMQQNHAEKTFRKVGLREHVFISPDGPRHVWSSAPSDKPDLMLVHGITSSANMWVINVRGLSKHYDLIIPDLIGHGGSTAHWSGNSVDAQVAHLCLILDSLRQAAPIFLMGNSYGGAMAANFAEQHPERVRTLIINDGPASDYTHAMADSIARAAGALDIIDLFSPDDADEQRRLMMTALYEPRKVPGFAMEQFNRNAIAHRGTQLPLLKDLLANEEQYSHKAYVWPMPVFVIWGEGDKLIPPAVGRGIVRRSGLPEDHLIVVPKAGHVPNIEQREVFEADVIRILGTADVGPCPDPAGVSSGACTAEYDPVCGCDGRTYANPCLPMRAGVRVVAQGPCR